MNRRVFPPTDDNDDLPFIKRTLNGDTRAFDTLVRKYYQKMYGLAYRMLGSPEDSEDVVQQAFLKAYTSLGRFRAKSSFLTWLYRITVNTALNEKKKRRPQTQLEEFQLPPVAAEGLNRLERGEAVKQVRLAIASLPERQRITLVLRVYEGLPFKEVADILNCSVGGAKANYFHAIRNVQKTLKSYLS